MTTITAHESMNLQETIAENRLVGLWRLMRGFRLIYLGAALSLGVSAAARSGSYLLLGYFVDNVLNGDASPSALPLIALGFIGVAVVTGAFTFFSGTLAARTSEGVAQRVREYLFDHIQRLTFTYHDQTQTGELIQRATSDVDAIRSFFADQAIGVGRILSLFIVNLTALLILNWQLALYSIIIVPFTVLLSFFFFQRVSKAYEAYQEQEAILSNRLQENLTGVRVVKAFARQSHEIDKFEIENWEKFLRGRRLLLMHSLFWPISDIMTGGQMLAGFFIGAVMAINGTISVGMYLSYAGMLIWIIWPIRNMGRLIVQMSSGLVSYKRLTDVIKQEREALDAGDYTPKDGLRGAIVFDNVGFAYADAPDTPVLQNISFECQPGQVIALLGSTGSGKTTLANLIPRFYEYTGGSITLDGVELEHYPRKYLRSQIGTVEQEPFLFSRSISGNIVYGVDRDVSDEEIENAARMASVHEAIAGFPDGYHTLVGEKGVTLSGGQKQRVAIARTIIKNPSILILDDATSSVDVETEADIRAALERLMENRTTFIIAHRIQSVMNADLIVVLDHGQIVQMGKHAELLSQDGVYRQIFDIQTRIDAEVEQEIGSVGN
ncbi:MAG: ABC transporter ATP-binding protein/permease [Chloroflexi bacterium]|nr:ABC transporter ATP-binding protein/permease [Chloroflexota bacterium]MBU1661202.1 ABC transporter ATP-binding protein/permease [Chloroflexota bacterium]